MRLIPLLAALAATAAAADASADAAPETAPVTRYENARLFDGFDFTPGVLCVQARRLVDCPEAPDAVVDLAGAWVTPPFGDAHTHHFDGPYTLDWHTGLALQSGAFYALTLTAPASGVAKIRDRLSGPGHVDVASALGGITGPESHPAEIYEGLAVGARSYEEQLARQDEIRASRRYADDAYFAIGSAAELEQKWPILLAGKPDLVKVFLRKSERYAEGYGKWGPGGGLDPALLPRVRELASAAGLRLAVANSSLADFQAAVAVGADLVTHLPCYQDSSSDPDSPYYDLDSAETCLIGADDARAAAAIPMAATLIVTEWAKSRPAEQVQWERANLATLDRAGVPFAVGSNAYGSTLVDGLVAGAEKGFFAPAQLLRIATMDTPRLIFPERRVGCLEVGCEASFIGFAGNPLQDFAAIRELVLRVKDGEPIAAAPAAD